MQCAWDTQWTFRGERRFFCVEHRAPHTAAGGGGDAAAGEGGVTDGEGGKDGGSVRKSGRRGGAAGLAMEAKKTWSFDANDQSGVFHFGKATGVYCAVCAEYDPSMSDTYMQCVGCKTEYHPACVGLTAASARTRKDWQCALCDPGYDLSSSSSSSSSSSASSSAARGGGKRKRDGDGDPFVAKEGECVCGEEVEAEAREGDEDDEVGAEGGRAGRKKKKKKGKSKAKKAKPTAPPTTLVCNHCFVCFHVACVGVSEEELDTILGNEALGIPSKAWYCMGCERSGSIEEYCVCEKPWEDAAEYIG